MRVYLTNAGVVTLLEPANFRGLDVLIDPQTPDQVERAISRIGRREGEGHVRLSPSVLRFLSPHAGEAEWEENFEKMITYAAKAGWVDESGMVRAHITIAEPQPSISPDVFKAAMRALPAGIAAITTGKGASRAAFIVSSLVSISAEPPLVGFFANRSVSALPALLAENRFAANVLGTGQEDIVNTMCSAPQGPARFSTGTWVEGKSGLPVLEGALATLECDIISSTTVGTHQFIVGHIRHSSSAIAAHPLVNFNGCVRHLPERLSA